MEFQYHGANCIKISTKQASIIVDDNLSELGLKSQTKSGDIALFTDAHGEPGVETKLTIDQPGEFEVSGVSITGYPMRAHMDEEGSATATMYRIVIGETRILITGHIYPELTDDQLESIGLVDVIIIPVGGNGYTMDGIGALKVIKSIEPKLVIPVHYADKAVAYPVPQNDLKEIQNTLSIDVKESTGKLKLKNSDIPESMQMVILERQ